NSPAPRTRRRLRVLYLTCHLPFPPHSGGRLRDAELIRHLADRADIHLCVVSKTYEQDLAHQAEAEGYCASVAILPAAPVTEDAADGTTPEKIRRHHCPEMRGLLAAKLAAGDFDVIHVEGYYLMQHVPADASVPVFLGTQNVEYLLEEQRSTLCGTASPVRAEVQDAARWAEESAWLRADACGAVSHDDLTHIRTHVRIPVTRWTPDGADHLFLTDTGDPLPDLGDGPRVLYLANFGYQPSADAGRLLCEQIWPLVHSQVPDARLILAGANPPDWLRKYAAHDRSITVTGPVESVTPLLLRADLFLAPLRIGGGVKVKILEALTAGCAVVTTPVGAQGLAPEVCAAMAVVADEHDTAEAATTLLRSPERREALRAAARDVASRLPSWPQAARLLHDAWLAMLDRVRTAARESTAARVDERVG
ncbi:glycosyltransferase, partial [Streptomyces antimycoticus]|uniref:glycosyltransferase n=1 Tax=Streptomyces antimycoticus TaxID=68175 RepID=UPI000A362E4B